MNSQLGDECLGCLADNASTMEAFGMCAAGAAMSEDPAAKMAECDAQYDVTVCDSACGCKLFIPILFPCLIQLHQHPLHPPPKSAAQSHNPALS